MKQAAPEFDRFYFEVCEPIFLPADSTREVAGGIVRKFSRWLREQHGSADLRHLTPELFGAYFLWLTRVDGRSGHTARSHRATLLPIVRLAVRRRLARIDPNEIPKPKADALRPQAWTMDQFELMLRAGQSLPGRIGPWRASDWMVALMLTTFCTDWRISAVMRLRVDRCSLETGIARTIDKRRQERIARLTPQCIDRLGRIWGPRDEVFGDWTFDRHSRQWKKLNKLLGHLIEQAGVPDIGRFHAIRKSAVTRVVDMLGLEAGARFAGHSSTKTTWNHYVDEGLLANDGGVLAALPVFQINAEQRMLF